MFRSITRLFTHRLANQLITAMVGVALLTAAAAGVPAYLLIENELDQQAWAQVTNAQRVTTILLDDRQSRLAELARRTATSPAIQAIMEGQTSPQLSAALQTIQDDNGLVLLTLRDSAGHILAGSDLAALSPALTRTGSAYAVLNGSRSEVVLVATQPVMVSGAPPSAGGYVTLALPLDDDFAQVLSGETGLEQSVLVGQQRTASSLTNPPAALSDPDAVQQVLSSGHAGQSAVTIGGRLFYSALLPLKDATGQPVAALELALPVESLVSARQQALQILLLSALGVAALSSLLAVYLARRLATPLEKLTQTAIAISQGDLDQAAPRLVRPAEIAALASALEASRENLQHTLGQLSRANAWSENLISSISEGVITFGVEGKIIFFSDGAGRTLGMTAADALGKPIDEILRMDKAGEKFSDHIPPRGGKEQVQVMAKDGRAMTLAITGERLVPPDGDTVQVALVLRDVTEEQASRNLQSYFLANITHEFRTPLAAINASLELLMDEAERLPQTGIATLLGSLYLSVLNLQTLIDNLLESTSIEAGRFTVRRRPSDINPIVARAVRSVQPVLTRRQQTLSLIEPLDLPTMSLDPTRLTQVLVNLLSNASKYSPIKTPIDVIVEIVDNQLRVSISDRGPGIPASERANLFRRFVRLDVPGEEQVGTGLGLSVARSIVDRHGGHIGVDGRAGGGSTFWLMLPL